MWIGDDVLASGNLLVLASWNFRLATGTSQRILPLDYAQDFHHMAWTPDGKVMAVAVGFRGSIWKFTPEGK